jgi:hypothetical protein
MPPDFWLNHLHISVSAKIIQIFAKRENLPHNFGVIRFSRKFAISCPANIFPRVCRLFLHTDDKFCHFCKNLQGKSFGYFAKMLVNVEYFRQ